HRVGIMNLESGRTLRTDDQVSLNGEIQQLINNGSVQEVFYDDEATAELLIVRDPRILHILPYGPCQITAEKIIITADESPFSYDGKEIKYVPKICHFNVTDAFGIQPVWSATNQTLRDTLETYLPSEVCHKAVWPTLVD